MAGAGDAVAASGAAELPTSNAPATGAAAASEAGEPVSAQTLSPRAVIGETDASKASGPGGAQLLPLRQSPPGTASDTAAASDAAELPSSSAAIGASTQQQLSSAMSGADATC